VLILGFNCYVFDSAACILRDGVLVAAAQEERFVRRKGTGEFPEQAIRYCLEAAGATMEDIDHVAFYWEPFHGLHHRLGHLISSLPGSLRFWSSHSGIWWSLVTAERELRRRIPTRDGRRAPFRFHSVRHHMAHAASTFLVSPFERAAILIMDGSGEISSTSLALGDGDRIQMLNDVRFPHSMGYVYVSLTQYLGFKPDSDEYKVMALASMGQRSDYYRRFCEIIALHERGAFRVDTRYFNYAQGGRDPWVSDRFIAELGPMRRRDGPLGDRHRNIAWALQKRLEDVALHAARYLHQQTGADALVVAGGCGLNSVLNEKLLRDGPFDAVWLQPAPNDAGTSVGAAYHVYVDELGHHREEVMESAYLGPEFSDEECAQALADAGLKAQKLDADALVEHVAATLADGKIVGWFQGRAEFGPRALGNRSILADPRRHDMRDTINAKIKHREAFRPFAPAVLEERADEFFEGARTLSFMSFVLTVRPEKRDLIPAVVHIDGTARAQTVTRRSNPRFRALIEAFDRLTTVPMLLNTSFNDAGEPIVNSPADAVRTFLATNLDTLVLGSHVVGGRP